MKKFPYAAKKGKTSAREAYEEWKKSSEHEESSIRNSLETQKIPDVSKASTESKKNFAQVFGFIVFLVWQQKAFLLLLHASLFWRKTALQSKSAPRRRKRRKKELNFEFEVFYELLQLTLVELLRKKKRSMESENFFDSLYVFSSSRPQTEPKFYFLLFGRKTFPFSTNLFFPAISTWLLTSAFCNLWILSRMCTCRDEDPQLICVVQVSRI